MTLWLVRAGRYGEREAVALEKNVAVIGWDNVPDLAQVQTREELKTFLRETQPDAKTDTINNWTGQIWAFRERIKTGDLIALPLKTRSAIAIGRVKGPYQYRADLPEGARHTRPVEWRRIDIPRSAFDQDLLHSLGSAMTVCQIQRNNAETRVQALVEGKAKLATAPGLEIEEQAIDIEEYAEDQIGNFIGRKFRGHDLARLVDAILIAQGYVTQRAPAGADRGVDIIAGRGPLGFDPPRLCVQVKSSDSPVDVSVLRELQGVLKNFGAQQGLLVSWGGFKTSVLNEARQLFFEIRLWDAGDLVHELIANYNQLSSDIQAELPLKPVWILVPED